MKKIRKEGIQTVPISFHNDPSSIVVLDASAVINLAGSGFSERILKALPNPVVTTDIVLEELHEGRMNGWPHADILEEHIRNSRIKLERLDEKTERIFESLVLGSSLDTLDDGEASALAVASASSHYAVIDEKKAIRVSSERFPALRLVSSCDLFCHPKVKQELGKDHLRQALFNALKETRMRVLDHHQQWVMVTLGATLASQCNSLPKVVRKSRFRNSITN